MSKLSNNTRWHAVFLILAAIILTVLPIPSVILWVWPHWVLLAVLYTIITKPSQYGIFFSFCIGLVVDLLMGSKLGVHALSYTIISYFILKIQQRFYLFPVLQQSILIFALVILDSVSIALFSTVRIDWVFVGSSVLSAMSTALIWLLFVNFYGIKQQLSRI